MIDHIIISVYSLFSVVYFALVHWDNIHFLTGLVTQVGFVQYLIQLLVLLCILLRLSIQKFAFCTAGGLFRFFAVHCAYLSSYYLPESQYTCSPQIFSVCSAQKNHKTKIQKPIQVWVDVSSCMKAGKTLALEQKPHYLMVEKRDGQQNNSLSLSYRLRSYTVSQKCKTCLAKRVTTKKNECNGQNCQLKYGCPHVAVLKHNSSPDSITVISAHNLVFLFLR